MAWGRPEVLPWQSQTSMETRASVCNVSEYVFTYCDVQGVGRGRKGRVCKMCAREHLKEILNPVNGCCKNEQMLFYSNYVLWCRVEPFSITSRGLAFLCRCSIFV